MKKTIAIIAIVLLVASSAWGGPKISKNGGGAAGTGSVATDTIWDAAGDLAIGTGANTAGRLAVGATNTLLYVNSDTPAWLALGAANTVLTSNGSALAWAATHSHSDSAAQFYNATNTSRLIKADASGITADSKTYTIKPITDVDVTFSPGKTYTDGKWCSYATATGFTCNEDAPAGSGDITAVGSCTSGSCATIGNADTSGGYIDFLEDSDNGTNYVRLKAPDSTDTATVTLPSATGTLALVDSQVFTTYIEAPYLILGSAATAADAGIIRLPNAQYIMAEADAAGTDINIIGVDSSEIIQIGSAGASGVTITPALTLSAQLNLMTTDADPATTAGGIKHDSSDTGASGGGSLKWFDGTNVRTLVDTGTTFTQITKYEYLPIRYAEDDVSVAAPAAAAEIGTTSLIGRSFAEDADNGVIFFWQIPSDYVSGIKYRVFYALNANGQADETAAFSLAGCSVGNSDALACSEGTAVVVTDELGTDDDTGELLVTGWSTAVTITDAAAGEMASLLLIRDVSEDDYSDHLLVSGIEIKYVSKLAPFSDY